MGKEKCVWSPQDDEILRNIANSLQKPINWKKALPTLRLYPNLRNVTSKQCRERWTNMLDQDSHLLDWSQKQQELLLIKHRETGNRWLHLSKYFPQRSENFLKNQFYSIFRRSLRRANKQIYLFRGNSVRPITTTIMLKMLSTCENKFENRQNCSQALIDAACNFKDVLAEYCRPCENSQMNKERVTRFIQSINNFRKQFRGVNKRQEKQKPMLVKKQRDYASYTSGQEIQFKISRKIETNQSNISSSLHYSQHLYDKQILKSVESIQPPMQPMMTSIYFSKMRYVQFGGYVQQQVPHFPIQPTFYQPFPNIMFPMIKQIPLSLQNSLMFYDNIRKQSGIQGTVMANSTYSYDMGVKQQEYR